MDIFDFDSELVFAILNGKVSMAVNRKLYRNFKKAGLEFTPEQWTVLSNLWQQEGITQQDLCNATFKDKPSMTRLIDNLEKQELVERKADKTDRRTNLIFLTKKGKKLKETANQTVLTTMQEAFSGLEEEELQVARKVLKVVFENIRDSMKE